MPKILIIQNESHPVHVDTFRETARDVDIDVLDLQNGGIHINEEQKILDSLSDHVAIFLRVGRITERIIENCPSLSAIVTHGSGYDHVDVEAATKNRVAVINSPEAPGPAVVEHTLGFMISLLRDFPGRFQKTAEGRWEEAHEPVPELSQQTIGVAGLGTIGFNVARLVADLNADVLGYDPYITENRNSAIYPRFDRESVEGIGVELVSKSELFERSDLVTVHVPLTDKTRNMVSTRELDGLHDGYLVNTARGGVIDEDALLEALSGDLAGAALDVLSEEPPDPDHPLVGHPRVYITPHIAGVTERYLERSAEGAAKKIQAIVTSETIDTVVNPAVFDP